MKYRDPDSALTMALSPDEWQWQLDRMLLADMADSLRWLVWSRSDDARRGRNMPERIQRPGVKSNREHIGDRPMTVAEMDRFLGWEVPA